MRARHLVPAAALTGLFRPPAHADTARDVSRDVLAADDGRAAYGTGTTGGAAADDAHVYTVTDRAGLVRALDGGSDIPKIIEIAGSIGADTDDFGRHLDRADYATGGCRLKKYLAAYDPRTWGSAGPTGPREEARQASAARQAERVRFAVGSHTTIVGPGDWTTAYDTLRPTGATHVWTDHVTASDEGHPGSERDLTADVGWTPAPHGKADSAAVADRAVARGAGAGRMP
jgi:pectate lyase